MPTPARTVPFREPLVGRKRELASVRSRGKKALCIVGMPGVGKSRLAAEIVRVRKNGSWVNLRGTTNVDGLLQRMADALAVALPGRTDASERLRALRRALDARRETIVLDDAEGCIDAVRWALPSLDGAAGVRFVITSRERLASAIADDLELEPLPYRTRGGRATSPSHELWVRNVRRRDHDYAVAGEEVELVSELLATLEGVPLAIEIAASWHELLGTRELTRRLGLPSSGVDPLSKAVEASWRMLGAQAKIGLFACATFAKSFDASTVSAVIERATLEADGALDVVRQLRHASLLGVGEVVQGTPRIYVPTGVARFVRRAIDDDSVKRRVHEAFVAHFARRSEEWCRARGESTFDDLTEEMPNLERAIDVAKELHSLADGVSCCEALDLWQDWTGWTDSAVARVLAFADVVIASPEADDDAKARAHVLRARAALATWDLDAALTDIRAARRCAGASPLTRVKREFLCGMLEIFSNDLGAASATLEEARRLAAVEPEARWLGVVMLGLTNIADQRGAADEALACTEEATKCFERAGARQDEILARASLGRLYAQRGLIERAREQRDMALRLVESKLARRQRPFVDYLQAFVLQAEGEHAASVEHYLRAARSDVGKEPWHQHLFEGLAGLALHAAGRPEEALPLVTSAARGFGGGRSAYRGMFVAAECAALASVGRTLEARAAWEDVPPTESALDRARAVFAAILDVAGSRLGEIDSTRRASIVEHARELVRRVDSHVETNDDVLVATWILRAELALLEGHRPLGRSLTVDASGAWIRGGTRITQLTKRPLLRKIVETLAAHAPAVVSEAELLRVAWDGQKILPASARNRLHVAISRLRAAGGFEWIVWTMGGYALHSDVTVERANM